RDSLWKNSNALKRLLSKTGFDLTASQTPILPVTFGEEAVAVRMSEQLADRGYFVPAIRPPSVPNGTSRLRVTLCATHSSEEVEGLAKELSELARGSG